MDLIQPIGPPSPLRPVVLIDAGHPSYKGDTGATVLRKGKVIKEAALNRTVANATWELLETMYSPVEVLQGGPRGSPRSLENRCLEARDRGTHFVVSVHHNASTDPKHSGTRVFYNGYQSARVAARAVLTCAPVGLNCHGRRPTAMSAKGWERVGNVLGGYHCPAILVEVGYMTNEGDLNEILNPVTRFAMATAITSGVARFVREEFGE